MLLIVCRLISIIGLPSLWFEMGDIRRVLGSNIKKVRREKKISQEQLANLCGLHRTYVGAIERGERNVSLINIQKIAKALKVPIQKLFME